MYELLRYTSLYLSPERHFVNTIAQQMLVPYHIYLGPLRFIAKASPLLSVVLFICSHRFLQNFPNTKEN